MHHFLWIRAATNEPSREHLREPVTPCRRGRRRSEGECIFLCELGPPEYAMTDAQGREMSNRWEEALQIKAWVAEIWQELGGDR